MTGFIPPEAVQDALVMGLLSLDGGVRHVRGVLPMAAIAREQGLKRFFAPEAALIPDLETIPVPSLAALHEHLSGGVQIPVMDLTPPDDAFLNLAGTDFSEIKGQEHVKRALEVASAGAHNLLMLCTKHLPFCVALVKG